MASAACVSMERLFDRTFRGACCGLVLHDQGSSGLGSILVQVFAASFKPPGRVAEAAEGALKLECRMSPINTYSGYDPHGP